MANTPKYTQARLFAQVFSALDGTIYDCDFVGESEARALAAFVKTHQRVNPRNAFDVIKLIWPPFTDSGDGIDPDEFPVARFVRDWWPGRGRNDMIHELAMSRIHERDLRMNMDSYMVNFPDGSVGQLITENGIGVMFDPVEETGRGSRLPIERRGSGSSRS